MPADEDHAHPGYDPGQDVVLDPRALRGLAHPIRLRLRSELANGGPATATQLAARIGESSGTTSYHLRQLAAYGFVADDPSLGNDRERYWRAVHRGLWFDTPLENLDNRAVAGEYARALARVYAERLVRFADSFETMPEQLGREWTSVAGMSDWSLDLSIEEARTLGRQLQELCAPYRRGDKARQGTRRVVVQFQLLPTADDTL